MRRSLAWCLAPACAWLLLVGAYANCHAQSPRGSRTNSDDDRRGSSNAPLAPGANPNASPPGSRPPGFGGNSNATQSAPPAVRPIAPPVALREPDGRDRDQRWDRERSRGRSGGGNTIFVPVPSVPWVWPGYGPNVGLPSSQPSLFVPQPAAPAVNPPAPTFDDPADQVRAQKVTSPEQKAKAGKFISYGDANFAKQDFLAASQRYRTATELAFDLPEAHLRQGHALVAIAEYEAATKAFRRALRLRSDWTASSFKLSDLYATNKLAKTAHLERLAQAVEDSPLDANLLIALGMELYFDGQRDRAGVFLERATQLGGNADGLLNDLLGQPAPQGAPPKAGGKIVF